MWRKAVSGISEERFSRLENKQDETKEIVIELRSDVKRTNERVDTMNTNFEKHIEIVNDHILGDNKIIDQLVDIIPDLADMVSDHKTKQAIKKEKKEKFNNFVSLCGSLAKIITFGTVVCGLLASTYAYLIK